MVERGAEGAAGGRDGTGDGGLLERGQASGAGGLQSCLAVARLSRASKDRMRSMAFSLHVRRALSGTEQRSHTISVLLDQ